MDPWYEALCVIAERRPAAYWRMANGAEFWWIPDRSQLGADRFRTEPFTYSEISSVMVFDHVLMGPNGCSCDWDAVYRELATSATLHIEHLQDVTFQAVVPPNNAIQLSLPSLGNLR